VLGRYLVLLGGKAPGPEFWRPGDLGTWKFWRPGVRSFLSRSDGEDEEDEAPLQRPRGEYTHGRIASRRRRRRNRMQECILNAAWRRRIV